LGRSRTWFYKTLERYRSGGRAALDKQKRSVDQVHNRTSSEVEATIVRIRQTIACGEDPDLRYSNIGAEAIAGELKRIGMNPPSTATINRILKRYGLVQKRSRKKKTEELPRDYPWPMVTQPNAVHYLDFTVRTIAGGVRIYGCNLLDQVRHWPYLRIIETKSAQVVSDFLVSAWQETGLPNALYIDNDPVWRGSGSGVRTFSKIVRLCLLVGVDVIFTPPYTPQANPFIESFISIWDRNYWQRTSFRSLAHAQSEILHFEKYCRYRRQIAEYNHKTPDQLFPEFVSETLDKDFIQHKQGGIPVTSGYVHFIRFVNHDGLFDILNEKWQLDKEKWSGKTVRATIDTNQQTLSIYHQAHKNAKNYMIAEFPYPIKEEVVPLNSQYQRQSHQIWPISEFPD
jgi:transposase InsO family protein